MKNKEELKQLKKEYEDFNRKINELTQDELKEVVGGGRSDKERCEIKENPHYTICPFSVSLIKLYMKDKNSPCIGCKKNHLQDGHWKEKQIWGSGD